MVEQDPLSLIGKTLAGHFLVESLRGEGRFSIVYRGEHIGPKESVALKCLKLGLELDSAGAETFLKRFREENKTNSRVSKGNALFVRSIGSGMTTSDAGVHVPYTVLEWLDGHSLTKELATRRAQGGTGRPLSEVLALLGPSIQALGHAHDADVAHGDVSPGSFFLAGGDMKVLDLGVAKLVSDLCREIDPSVVHARIFSPQYGAPEHFDPRLGEFGPWTDVYGIALVILELLRDRPAVDVVGTGSTREQSSVVLDPKKRPTPRSLGLRAGDAVEKVMARAVALVARDRYANASEFLAALKAAMQKDAAAPIERAPNGKIDAYSPADDELDTLVRPPEVDKVSDKTALSEPRPAAVAGASPAVASAVAAKAIPKPHSTSTPAPAASLSTAPAVLPHAPQPSHAAQPSHAPHASPIKSVPVSMKPAPLVVPAGTRGTTKMVVPPPTARISTPAGKPDLPAAPGPSLPSAPMATPHHVPPPPPAGPVTATPAPAPPPPPPMPSVIVAPAPPPPMTGIGDMSKNVANVIPPAPTKMPVGDLPSVIVEDPDAGRPGDQRQQDQMLRHRDTVRLDARPGAPPWMPQPPAPPGSNPGPIGPAAASSPGAGALPIVALQDRNDAEGRRPAMSFEARRARSRSRLIIVAFVSFLVVFLAGATILGVHWFLAAREGAPPLTSPTSTSP